MRPNKTGPSTAVNCRATPDRQPGLSRLRGCNILARRTLALPSVEGAMSRTSKKSTSTERTSKTEAVTERDPVWAELLHTEGLKPGNGVTRYINRVVHLAKVDAERRKGPWGEKNPVAPCTCTTLSLPDRIPEVDDMLEDLILDGSVAFVADKEHEIFVEWMHLQAKKHNTTYVKTLTVEEFTNRYWGTLARLLRDGDEDEE